MVKIYSKNKYLIIDDGINELYHPSIHVLVRKNGDVYDIFLLEPSPAKKILKTYSLNEIVDEDNNPYTEESWIEFYTDL